MKTTPEKKGEGETQKHPGGRPSEYKPEYAEQAEKLCTLGAIDCEIAEFFDVDVRTIHRWKLNHPEFCHALKVGKELADERVKRSLYQKATGFRYKEEQAFKIKVDQFEEDVKVVEVEREALPDTPAAIFWLKNRAGWTDKTEVQHSGGIKTTGFDLSKLSDEELAAVTSIAEKATIAPPAND